VVPLRSSSCLSPDLVFQAFSFRVHDLAFWTEPPKVVWNLLLQAGSEGPSLIDQTVAHSNSLLAALVLVAHYCRYPVQVTLGTDGTTSIYGFAVIRQLRNIPTSPKPTSRTRQPVAQAGIAPIQVPIQLGHDLGMDLEVHGIEKTMYLS